MSKARLLLTRPGHPRHSLVESCQRVCDQVTDDRQEKKKVNNDFETARQQQTIGALLESARENHVWKVFYTKSFFFDLPCMGSSSNHACKSDEVLIYLKQQKSLIFGLPSGFFLSRRNRSNLSLRSLPGIFFSWFPCCYFDMPKSHSIQFWS